MRILKTIKSVLYRIDFFTTSQFLCYKGENSYATATGGFLSACIIIIFLVLFTNTGMQVIHKDNVNTSSFFEQSSDPSYAAVQAGPAGDFMFILDILGANITDPDIKLFDIKILQEEYAPVGRLINSTRIDMVQCTPDHFAFTD